MAIEEVGLIRHKEQGSGKLTGAQEFSIEIPDKEADAIHSGMFSRREIYDVQANIHAVNQAVQYILSQPDGKMPRSATEPTHN